MTCGLTNRSTRIDYLGYLFNLVEPVKSSLVGIRFAGPSIGLAQTLGRYGRYERN